MVLFGPDFRDAVNVEKIKRAVKIKEGLLALTCLQPHQACKGEIHQGRPGVKTPEIQPQATGGKFSGNQVLPFGK
ncbi:hypothetical protein GCM10008938_36180 [Deinococcus roseus]|uniref:Uncharacterized protein n=1 Tax=Deinococcus roseus TaxID=392414 RepID=A0ABQ2D5I8_9DEIO|nr:hypothetical protein GCM10008938_36180 [Deinococcus roseus]